MFTIHKADIVGPGDLATIELLMEDVVPSIEGDLTRNLANIATNNGAFLITGRDESEALRGFLVLNLLPKITGREARVNDFVVHPDYRQQGLGTLLLKTAGECAGALGAYKLELAIDPDNIAASALAETLFGEPIHKGIFRSYL